MDNTKKTKRKDIRRRALAALCAVTIAVLQCAVILTIDTETVYGEDISVSVNVIVTNDKTPGSASGSAKLEATKEITIADPESETGTRTVKGRTVGDFVSELKLSEKPNKISPNNEPSSTSLSSDDVIAKIDGSLIVFKKSGDIWEQKADVSSGMDLEMKSSYTPIKSITISPTTFTPKVGTPVEFTASVGSIDDFFKDDKDTYFKVDWSYNGPASFNSSATKATLTPTADGTFSVNATLSANSSISAGGSGTSETTTTTTEPTTKPADNPKDLRTATVKTDGKLVKGKAYTNSEMKSHLTLTDSNGKTIDKKYWEVISVSRDGNDYEVTIKASKAGKEKGYFDIKETTVKATKTATTTKYKYTTRKYSGGGVTRSTRINVTGGETTSSLPPTVTYAPDRTITVKEVFLGSKIEDDQQESQNPWDDSNDNWNDDSSDDWTETEMQEEISLDFGPAVGSAAVAAAACGAGMVGRIRRFHVDTRAADAAASQTGKTKKLKLKK